MNSNLAETWYTYVNDVSNYLLFSSLNCTHKVTITIKIQIVNILGLFLSSCAHLDLNIWSEDSKGTSVKQFSQLYLKNK